MDLLIIPKLIYFFILTTCLLNIVLILLGEILSSSLMGVKGLTGDLIILLMMVMMVMMVKQCLLTIVMMVKQNLFMLKIILKSFLTD